MPIPQPDIQTALGAQQRVARDLLPQVRLLAGPGTGKSSSIEQRVHSLLVRGITAQNIYVVSFTRASARDLRPRIERYCHANGIPPNIRIAVTTLHSFALRVLRIANMLGGYPADPLVLDQWELENIFNGEFSKDTGYSPARCEEIRREHEAFWSTGAWGPPNYIPPNPPISSAERGSFQQFHPPRTRTYSCVLPGEIVRECVTKMTAGLLDPVQLLGMEHLIIDEYQDLNPADLEFVDHVARTGASTFVAGDDDQSIYSFRFASPAGIQQFAAKYPGAGQHTLNDCFRCTPVVLDAALALLAAFPPQNRMPKALQSLYRNAAPAVRGNVVRWTFRSGALEARGISESCRDLIAAGIPPNEILILLSNKRVLMGPLTAALQRATVEYEPPKAEGYIDLPSGRLALAMLRIVCNNNDYVAHRTVLGLRRGVGVGTCSDIAKAVILNNMNYRDLFYVPLPPGVFSRRGVAAIQAAAAVCAQVNQWQPTDTLAQRTANFAALLSQVLVSPHASAEWNNATGRLPPDMTLEELRDYFWAETDEQEAEVLRNVYERTGVEAPADQLLPPRVRVMTMHGAKGLSARVVFVPGLEEDIFPGQRRRPYPGLVLEAARLLYVSITRARAACILSYAQNRIMYGQPTRVAPSQFNAALGGPFAAQAGGLSPQEVQQIAADCLLL